MNTEAKTHFTAIGWVGVIAVVAFCVMWLACLSADSSWSWGNNSLSDFGVSRTDAADYFNYGLVIAGALLALYGIGRLQTNQKKLGFSVGGALLTLTGFAVVLIGMLTKDVDSGNFHDFFGILTIIFLSCAIIAITVQEYYDGRILPVGISLVIIFAVIGFAILFEFEEFEVWAIVAAMIWVLMDAALMIAAGIKEGQGQ